MNKFSKKLHSFLLGLTALIMMAGAKADQQEQAFTTATRYDSAGRVTGVISPDPDGVTGSLRLLATRNTYHPTTGLLEKTERGELRDWQAETVEPSGWTNYTIFTIFSSKVFTYDDYGRNVTVTVKGKDGQAISLTQTNYDVADRIKCRTVRMNAAYFNSPSSLPDACVLGATGNYGPDRITRYTYNNLDQIETETRALDAPLVQTYVTNKYIGAYLVSQEDANGNKTELKYDAVGRLTHRYYPSATSIGSVNYSDYNWYSYDINNNINLERKRNGALVTSTFDNNNRLILKDYDNNVRQKDIYYDYNALGLLKSARFESTAGAGVVNTYDGFGNLTSATNNLSSNTQNISFGYDDNGNRTNLNFLTGIADDNYPPVNQHGTGAVVYGFDGLNRMASVAVKIGGNPSRQLVSLRYSPNGKRSTISRNGTTTTYAYANGIQLDNFKQSFSNYNYNLTTDFTFNQAGQIATLKQSNSKFSYQGDLNRTGAYTPDGLNRYTTIAGQRLEYNDGKSNLTNYDNFVYTYDDENRLLTASNGSVNASFVYDPNGRLFRSTINGSITEFQYAGDALVAEYDGSGAVKKRYVHGDQVDEPLVQYSGTNFGVYDHVFLTTDHQGSIIALSDYSGSVSRTIAYDVYGIPASSNVAASRFGYTGQQYFSDIGLNYYKARWYSPKLGRFLQTDPIGYKDDYNLYAYVGNDPVNKTDPTGMITVVHANAADMQEYQNAVSYLSSDPGAAADFAQLEASPDTYNIYVASGNPTIYNSSTKNIGWDPKEGLKVKGGVQSPALGLRHEVDHAAQHDKTGKAVTRASNGSPTAASKAEERRAVKNETKTAKNLGEPTRSSHNQGKPVQVPNSTHSCVKTKTNPC